MMSKDEVMDAIDDWEGARFLMNKRLAQIKMKKLHKDNVSNIKEFQINDMHRPANGLECFYCDRNLNCTKHKYERKQRIQDEIDPWVKNKNIKAREKDANKNKVAGKGNSPTKFISAPLN